jgi:hypothetical protein
MELSSENEFMNNLALALIYLSSWKEDEVRMAWKGYDFTILDKLKEEGYVHFSNRAKSLYLTTEGVKKAEAAVEKLKQVTNP